MSGQLHRATDDGVQQGPAIDPHELLGGAETRRGARRQHDDVNMGGVVYDGFHARRQRRDSRATAKTASTQIPAIMAVLPATSAKAERGMTSRTTRMPSAASVRTESRPRRRAVPPRARISEAFCGSRFMGADITPLAPQITRSAPTNR